MRCWRMRCWDIWRCWEPVSFYSQLMRLWKRTKSWEAVLAKLNEHPTKNAERLDRERHVFCEGHQKSYSLGECLMCKIFPEDTNERWILDACCYNFEWDWNWYVFFCHQKSNNEQMLMSTRTKVKPIEEDDYEWIMEECLSEPGPTEPGEYLTQ